MLQCGWPSITLCVLSRCHAFATPCILLVAACVTVQVLDLGSCGSLWRLPASLLDLSALTRLVLTSKAVGQDIVERLELRSLNPVEVEFAGDDDWDDHRGDYLYDDYYTMEEYEFA